MRKKSKMIFSVLTLTLLLSLTAFAGSPQASYSWSSSSPGTYTSSNAIKKDTADADVYPQSGSNYSNGIFYNVKRGSSYVGGGTLRYNLNHFSISYKSGQAIANKYYNLFLRKYDSGKTSISGYWYP